MSPHLQSWDAFKREKFVKPYPSIRTVKKWIHDGDIPGEVIGTKVFIDIVKYRESEEENKTITQEAMELFQ